MFRRKKPTGAKKHPTQPTEFSKITEYIYVGTNMCCTMHFRKLLQMDIQADIDLEDERLEKPKHIDIFLWLPTIDNHAPTQRQLIGGARLIQALVSNRIKMYVHCEKGHGRAPTLVAAYLILEGMNPAQAVEFVKKRRPITHYSRLQLLALAGFAKKFR